MINALQAELHDLETGEDKARNPPGERKLAKIELKRRIEERKGKR